jgi:hypothetical protein
VRAGLGLWRAVVQLSAALGMTASRGAIFGRRQRVVGEESWRKSRRLVDQTSTGYVLLGKREDRPFLVGLLLKYWRRCGIDGGKCHVSSELAFAGSSRMRPFLHADGLFPR